MNDKQTNLISEEARHTCKFYDAMNIWYHQNGVVMKHISTSSSDNVDIDCDSQELKKEEFAKTILLTSSVRKVSEKMIYEEKAFELRSQLVVNN